MSETPLPKECCSKCRFMNITKDLESRTFFKCRRYPPQSYSDTYSHYYGNSDCLDIMTKAETEFPDVNPLEWCGEYELRTV